MIDFQKIKERVHGAQFTFGLALAYIRRGHRVRRAGWNGKNMWVRQLNFSHDAEFTYRELDYAEGTLMPFLVLKTPNNQLFPWNASQEDVMATDWEIEGPVYLFALLDEDKTDIETDKPVFNVTLKKVWDHRHLLDDVWLRHPHQMLSPRWSRVRDSTYMFDGMVVEALAELFALGWDTTEEFRAFCNGRTA